MGPVKEVIEVNVAPEGDVILLCGDGVAHALKYVNINDNVDFQSPY